MTLALFVVLTALQLAFAGFILFLCVAFVTGGPFVPSSKNSVRAMIMLARLHPGQTVIDVGSGDGRVLFDAAKKGVKAMGIEINPYLVLYTRFRAFLSPYRGNITVLWKNLWETDLSMADVVFVYLIPWKMDVLAAKLKRELAPGSLVVSNSFIFPNWPIIRQDKKHHAYVYKV